MGHKLTGKVAVVTGASKGIGAAIARHLAAEGAAVIVNYASSKEGADRVVADIKKAGEKAVAVGANMSKKSEVEHLFAEAKKSFGPVNILVNNAGVYAFAPIEAITEEHFHSQFNLNVLGLLLATQQAVAHMGTSGGSIINISSVVSTLAPPAGSVYSATKAAVDAITMSLAKELGPRHIRVNSINPGPVATEGTTELFNEEMKKHFISQTPLGRIGQPDDIASAAVFLASPDSGWITGETIHLTGGLR
jgi:3-oxoacyl-[acyl-carrier protein] reductase